MRDKKSLGPVSLVILFVLGGFFLYMSISCLFDIGKLMIDAANYTPQEVTLTDEEGILQQKDELKAALQKYSEKAGISIKLVVCYKINGENGTVYSVNRGPLNDAQPVDLYDYMDGYFKENDLITDNRTALMVMVYDAETSDFLEDYCHTDNSLAYSSELSQSQNGMYYVFEKNREEGRSPEQAVIEAIEKYLPRVERFVPVNLNQYGMSDGWKSVAFYLLFAAIGGLLFGIALSSVIGSFRSRSPRSYENEEDPLHDAMEWYQNKTPRSAPLPDKDSENYYSALFGGRKNDDE